MIVASKSKHLMKALKFPVLSSPKWYAITPLYLSHVLCHTLQLFHHPLHILGPLPYYPKGNLPLSPWDQLHASTDASASAYLPVVPRDHTFSTSHVNANKYPVVNHNVSSKVISHSGNSYWTGIPLGKISSNPVLNLEDKVPLGPGSIDKKNNTRARERKQPIWLKDFYTL